MREVPELANTPLIGVATLFGSEGKLHHKITIRLPFTDERVGEILRGEARQLSKDDRGLIMINVSMSQTEVPFWVSMIERRFQPQIHTRVSGVCLFGEDMEQEGERYNWCLRAKLLINPHAKTPLSEWIARMIDLASSPIPPS